MQTVNQNSRFSKLTSVKFNKQLSKYVEVDKITCNQWKIKFLPYWVLNCFVNFIFVLTGNNLFLFSLHDSINSEHRVRKPIVYKTEIRIFTAWLCHGNIQKISLKGKIKIFRKKI